MTLRGALIRAETQIREQSPNNQFGGAMTRISNPLWAASDDYKAATVAMKIGALAAFAGACIAVVLAAMQFRSNSLDVTSVAFAFCGVMFFVAAVRIARRSGAAAQAAIVLWVALGLLPTDLSLWIAISILVGLVAAVRGAKVLANIQSGT